MEQRARLESWKEISSYLNRSLTTCHRWEEELGLPVHRLDGTPKARVFAYPEELDRWLDEKLHLAEALTEKEGLARPQKRSWLLAAAGALALLAGGLLFAWRFLGPPAPVPSNNPWLAILPFENVTGDETLEAWTTAFPDLLTTDLRQSRYINVLSLTEVDRALQRLGLSESRRFSPENFAQIAGELDVDYAAAGTLLKTGDDFVANVFFYDAKARQSLPAIRSKGLGEKSLLGIADRLSRQLKLAASLAPRAVSRDIDRPVARVSSSSPEAFKLYSRGYRLVSRGKELEGIVSLRKAVEIDPDFGLAYKGLFVACRIAGRRDDLIAYAEAAIRLSRRLSERELLLLEAEYYDDFYNDFQPDKAKALRVNEKLWDIFPDYPEGPANRLFLPRLYLSVEEYDRVIEALEKLGSRNRNKLADPEALISCYIAKGLSDKAEKAIDEFHAHNPDRQSVEASLRRHLLLAQRRFGEAVALTRGLPGLTTQPPSYPAFGVLGYTLWAADDLTGAEDAYGTVVVPDNPDVAYRRLINLSVVALSGGKIGRLADLARQGFEVAKNLKRAEWEADWSYILALALRLSGQLPDALRESEEACRAYEKQGLPGLLARQLRALITLDLGRTIEFEKQVEEIRRIVELEPNRKLRRAYFHLLGHRELRKGEIEKATGFFWKALDLLPGVMPGLADGDPVRHFYWLAEAYFRDGRIYDAIPFYEKVVAATSGRSFSGDIYALSFYRLGKAYERGLKGRSSSSPGDFRAKAMENFRKFLALWKDADPIFPEIEDAKKCLTGLEAGGPPPANRSD